MKLLPSSTSGKHYSSVEDKAKGLRSFRAKGNESRASLPNVSISIAKNSARSMIPKFLLSPCSPRASTKTGPGRLGYDAYKDYDDMTPVIMYTDEDTVKKPRDDKPSFVDPFAFEPKKEPPIVPKKKVIDKEKVSSPTSVFGLFTVQEEGSFIDNCSDDEEEAVFFNDPFFPRSLTHVFDENTSIDISESIHSINAPSVSDGDEHEVTDKDEGTPTTEWFGFFNSESFTSCEWEPDSDNESFE